MSVFEQLKSDLTEARKLLVCEKTDVQTIKVSILRLLVSEFDTKGNSTPDQSDKLVYKKIREYIESNTLVKDKNVVGSDKFIKADMENAILESYLPTQMSTTELTDKVADIVSRHNITDMRGMQIIKAEFESQYPNQYDKKELGAIAKTIITKGK